MVGAVCAGLVTVLGVVAVAVVLQSGLLPERRLLATVTVALVAGAGTTVTALLVRLGLRRARLRLVDEDHAGVTALADWVESICQSVHQGRREWPVGAIRVMSLERLRRGEATVSDGILDPERVRLAAGITQLVDALEVEHAFRSVVDASGDVVVVVDDAGTVTFAARSLTRVLSWPVSAVHGRPLAALVHGDDIPLLRQLIGNGPGYARRRSDTDGAPSPLQPPVGDRAPRLRVCGADGSWRVLEWVAARAEGGELGALVLSGRDVTDRVEFEQALQHQASHDALTGLPNRTAFNDLTAAAVREATAELPACVVMIDLDRFKEVNDSLGHLVGDQLLGQVGPRLRAMLRPHDTVARLGGDEFAVLLPSTTQQEGMAIAERLSDNLDDVFVVADMELHVGASFGLAVSHRGERSEPASVELLMREADIAMYRAKSGGTGIAAFDAERDGGRSRERLEMTSELRRALGENQIVVHYQPVVDVVEGELVGVEALVRWQHPERGLLPPGAFLDIAESSGLIVPMSKVVLATAVAQIAAWSAQGARVQVAVNLAPRWLQHSDVADTVALELARHGVPASLLRLEITENMVLDSSGVTLPALERLRDMGIGLSLDDFGTGYSSMTHLRNLPVDELKVDRGFVNAMTTSPQDAVIVRAAVELGHNLGMNVVAEGIEDAETLAEVVASGCGRAQGYYFSKPLPADELEVWADEKFPTWRAVKPVRV